MFSLFPDINYWRNSEDTTWTLLFFLYFPFLFLENGMKIGNVRYQLRKTQHIHLLLLGTTLLPWCNHESSVEELFRGNQRIAFMSKD